MDFSYGQRFTFAAVKSSKPLLKSRSGGNHSAAFTLLELVVATALVVILVLLALPTLKQALAKRDMNRTMDNARELYLAGFHMATDGAAKSDGNRVWPGDYATGMTSLANYCNKLSQNGYLAASDLRKILNAPGATCTVSEELATHEIKLAGQSALKVYKVKNADPSDTIFALSANYIYDKALDPTAAPFGDNGFVVIRRSGESGVYRKKEATTAGWGNDVHKFQSSIGRRPGDAEGAVTPGDSNVTLTSP